MAFNSPAERQQPLSPNMQLYRPQGTSNNDVFVDEHGVAGVAVGALEIIAIHAVVLFCVTDRWLDRRTSSQVTLDRAGDAAFLARDVRIKRGADRVNATDSAKIQQ